MPSKKAAPNTRNLTRHVSLYLNLEKPVLTVAFQEKIEDVAHLLDEEQSILATPTNTHDSFLRHLFGFCLKTEFMRGPGRCDTSHLSDFNETW